MDKAQLPGVEALARQAGHRLFGPVHHVSQQGVAQVGHVHPNLVGAPRLQAALQVGVPGVAAQHGPVGHGEAAVLPVHRHLLPVHAVAADRGVHRARILPEAPHGNGLIHPGQGVVLELGGQGQVGPVILGGNDEPRGVPVNAVDDAGAQLAVDSREGIFAVI